MKVSRLEGDSYTDWATARDEDGAGMLAAALVLVLCNIVIFGYVYWRWFL
jgi:hypothetical protein